MSLSPHAVVVTAVYTTALVLGGTSTPARVIGAVLLAVLAVTAVSRCRRRLRRTFVGRTAAVLHREDATAAQATVT
jgi:hypothetical protein